MVNWSAARLAIEFDSHAVKDRTMSMMILYNGDVVWHSVPMPEGISVWAHNIVLPAKVSLIVGNRNGLTTIVDDNNEIVSNMLISIKSITLDGLPIWDYWTDDNIIAECDESDELVLGPNLCINGRVDLLFDELNAFNWVVKTKLH